MRNRQSNSPRRNVSLRYLAVLTASLVMILMYAGCGTQETQQSTPGDNTGVPTSTTYGRSLGDTPIVISGGSVHLELNNGTFKPCAGTTTPRCPDPSMAGNEMYWATGQIEAGNYFNDNPNSADTAYPISITSQAVVITIKCSGGGDAGDVIIKNDIPANNRVLVEFEETNKFKPLRPGSHRRVAKKFSVDTIKVKDGANPEKDYAATEAATWPPGKKVTIELFDRP